MEIKLNARLSSVARIASAQPAARVNHTPEVDGFAGSHALEARLAATPDVRPEAVERAKQLIGDPGYPPNEAIEKIATLLAMEIELLPKEI